MERTITNKKTVSAFQPYVDNCSIKLKLPFLTALLFFCCFSSAWAVPQINSFSPASGKPGSLVKVRGTGFTGTLNVTFNGVNAGFTVSGDTLITATVPNDTASGVIQVRTTQGNAISPGSFTVIFNAPVINSFSPALGTWGSVVTIKGKYFSRTVIVRIGIYNCNFTVDNDSTLRVTIPQFASTAVFYVTANQLTSISSGSFNVAPPQPSIKSFSPTIGPAGTVVTIIGKNLQFVDLVHFYNGVSASFTRINDSTLTTTVPAFSSTGVITVFSNTLNAVSPGSFVVGYPAPVITSFSPSLGSIGNAVVIKGVNLSSTTQVAFYNNQTASFTTSGDTMITAIVPSLAASGVIKVTTLGGAVLTAGNFTVIPIPPVITSFTPVSGPAGTVVTLKGKYFTSTTLVRFNGATSAYTVVNDSTITATVPGNASTGVILVTARGLTAVSSGSFLVANPPPVISSFSPTSGQVTTTIVTIKGRYFTGATAVRFNGVNSSYTILNDSTINATVPASASTGVISVVVSSQTALSPGSFQVLSSIATIKDFNPKTGGARSNVIIKGTNFTNTTQVTFYNGAAAAFTVLNDSTILVTVPVAAQSGLIRVTTLANTALSPSTFVVIPTPPTIDSFSPTSGPANTVVTITGHYFTGTSVVRFNGVIASFNVLNDSTISATVPDGAGTGLITITAGLQAGISSGTFTYVNLVPLITDFQPSAGSVGTQVTIKGTLFGKTTAVRFNGVVSSYVLYGDTQIVATVPNGVATGVITVVSNGLTATSPGSFTIIPIGPVINGFNPILGPVGTVVTLKGRYFTGTSLVRFNGVTANFTLVNDSTLKATVPTGANTGVIVVTANNLSAISLGTFQVLGVEPAITSFSPLTGPVGTSVTLTGKLFIGTTEVRFNGSLAPFTIINDSSIVATVPQNASSGVISLRSQGVVAISSGNFIVQSSPPILSSFTPNQGAVGTIVAVNGKNFTGTTQFRFNGVIASFTVLNDTTLNVTVPTGATTGILSVTANGLTSVSAATFQVIQTLASVTSFSPVSGPTGTLVTLKGQNFKNVTQVAFGTAVSSFSLLSDSVITATVPANAVTAIITVTASGYQAQSQGSFQVVIPQPVIGSFSPLSGPVGTSVLIKGNYFTGLTAVSFNGTTAAFSRIGDTLILATVPTGAVSGIITITVLGQNAGSQSSFTVISLPPSIKLISPALGPEGSAFQVSGKNLGLATQVLLNGNSAPYTIINDSVISVNVPVGATTGYVVVNTPNGNAISSNQFTVTIVTPGLASFNPSIGSAGTAVLISGSNLGGVNSVLFNGTVATFTILNSTSIRAVVPSGATSGQITISAPGGTINSSQTFNIVPPPVILGFTPGFGPVGGNVIITGTGFTGTTAINFNGIPSNFTLNSATQLTATVPVGASTGLISVITPAGIAYSAANYKVTFVPSADSLIPDQGIAGTQVQVRGKNLGAISQVWFGTTQATFTLGNDSVLNAIVPVGAISSKLWLFNATDSGLSKMIFTVLALPSITGFTPNKGPIGATVLVNGSNFTGINHVWVGGQEVAYSLVGANQLSLIIPAGSSGGTIKISSLAGSDSTTSLFKVVAPPVITALGDGSGQPGSTILVSGHNFTELTSVQFNGTNALFSVLNDSTISVTVPLLASSGPITVNSPGGTATSAETFLVLVAPKITGFAPVASQPGDTVSISGTNLTGTFGITFNALNANFFAGPNGTLLAVIPKGTGAGPIVLKTLGGADTSKLFFTTTPIKWNYCQPVYTSKNCNGNFINSVSITGTSFSISNNPCIAWSGNSWSVIPAENSHTGTLVTGKPYTLNVGIGSGTPSSVSAWIDFNRNGLFEPSEYLAVSTGLPASSTASIGFTVPQGLPEGGLAVRLRIRTAGSANGPTDACTSFGSGASIDFVLNLVNPKIPKIVSFTPAKGLPGSNILVKGINFTGTSLISFNGTSTTYNLLSDTVIQVTVPAGATSGLLSITNSFGQASSLDSFKVLIPASLSLTSFGGTFCATDSVPVSVKAIGEFGPANLFSLQLSDSAGSFNLPTNLKTGLRTVGGMFVKLPRLVSGSRYRIRVISTDPVLISDNGSDLKINALPLIDAGPDQFVCQNGLPIPLPAASPAGGVWKGAIVTRGNMIVVSNPGTYSVWYKYTNTAGCSDSAQNIVTVLATPQAPVISYSSNLSFCQGDSVVLSAPKAFGYLWNNGDTTRTIKVKTTGNYTLQTVEASGCTSLVSTPVTVTVNALPIQPVIQTRGSLSVCDGDSVALEAPFGVNPLWTTGATTQRIWVKVASIIGLTVTNANGCKAIANPVTVSIQAKPTKPVIAVAGNSTFCQGDSVELRASGTGTNFVWSNGAIGSVIRVKASGWYSAVSANNFGCLSDSSLKVQVTVLPKPSRPAISASGDTNICAGDSVTLTASNANSYLWSNGATTRSITVKRNGQFGLVVKNAAGCYSDSSKTVRVRVLAPPVAGFIANGNLLTVTQSGTRYQWLFNGQPIFGAIASAYNISPPIGAGTGNYRVIVYSGNCYDTSAAKYVSILGVERKVQNPQIRLYPNPASEAFTLEYAAEKGNRVSFLNALGEQLKVVDLEENVNTHLINVSDLPKGMYVIKISGVNTLITRQIMVK